MATRSARRPLPALVFLVALAVLASIVWYRVDHRSQAQAIGTRACPTPNAQVLPASANVTVKVINANGTDGLAGTTSKGLTTFGFLAANPPTDNADATVDDVATITSGAAGAAGAKLLSFFVPGSTIAGNGATDAVVTLTVGKKFTALATADAAKAAMVAAKVSQAPPSTAAAPPTPGATSPVASPSSSPTC